MRVAERQLPPALSLDRRLSNDTVWHTRRHPTTWRWLMARGRMISTTIGESRKFAALENHLHRLIYLMVLPHVDKAGRFEADPIVIKSKCLMRLDVDASTVEAWLKDGVRTGLLRVYDVDGLRYLEIVNFGEHNTPHHKEPDSKLPPPDSGTACYTQDSNVEPSMSQASANVEPSKAIREVKRRELEREEKRELSSPEIQVTRPPSLSATRTRIDHQLFTDAWNQHRGRLPAVLELNDWRKAKLDKHLKEAKGDTDKLLALVIDATRAVAQDDYWLEKQYGFDNLMRENKLTARAEQWRNGPVQAGNGKIVSTFAHVADAIGGLDDRPN